MKPRGLSAGIASSLDRLSPRERVLLGLMAVIGLATVGFLLVLVGHRSTAAVERTVRAQAEQLGRLREDAAEIRTRLDAAKQPGGRAAGELPPLGSQLEKHASKAGVTIPEMRDQPEEAVGGWVRKSIEVRLRREPLGKVANFWAEIENDRNEYPVAITKLNVRRRWHEQDSYDVEMIVSAYAPAAKQAEGGAAATRGRSKAGTRDKAVQ